MPLLLMLWLSVVPQGQILIRGAAPSASDATTPVPEQGRASGGRYRNAYFGLTYPIPAGWSEQPAGPPPSDGGSYVLTQFATEKAHVLVTAQDLFFTPMPLASSKELLAAMRGGLEPVYAIENEPREVTIAGRTFHRFSYKAPRSGLKWRVLTTDARCHALTFTFTGTDPATLDAAEQALRGLSLQPRAPACIEGYAEGANVLAKEDPLITTRHFNTIPVRVVIDAKGRVRHVHVLSAFPEQSQAILAALAKWRFKPHGAGEVETGIVFGMPINRPRAQPARR